MVELPLETPISLLRVLGFQAEHTWEAGETPGDRFLLPVWQKQMEFPARDIGLGYCRPLGMNHQMGNHLCVCLSGFFLIFFF